MQIAESSGKLVGIGIVFDGIIDGQQRFEREIFGHHLFPDSKRFFTMDGTDGHTGSKAALPVVGKKKKTSVETQSLP